MARADDSSNDTTALSVDCPIMASSSSLSHGESGVTDTAGDGLRGESGVTDTAGDFLREKAASSM